MAKLTALIFELCTEVKEVLRIGFPMTLTQSMFGIIYPVTLAFCGYLGTDQLDQASLALSVYQLFVTTVETGLRWTTLTFFGQVRHGPNPERVGIYLQRGILAAVSLFAIALCVSCNAANLLMLLGQDPEIAIGAEQFIMILMPGCLSSLIFRVLMAYMDSFKRVYPSCCVIAIFCVVCVLSEYMIIHHTDLGIIGVAMCLSCCQCTLPWMMAVCIKISGVYRETWNGWTKRSLLQWRQFYQVLVPVSLANLVYFTSTELGAFIAGILGKKELAAQSIMFQVYMIGSQLSAGLVSAGMVIITGYVSMGLPRKAKLATLALFVLATTYGLIFAIVILTFPSALARIFSQDKEVIALFSSLSGFLAFYAAGFLSTRSFASVLRAYNKNKTMLILGIINFYIIGHPLGISLTFAAHLGLTGLWIGFSAVIVSRIVSNGLVLSFLQWDTNSKKVSAKMTVDTDIDDETNRVRESSPLLPEADEERENEAYNKTVKLRHVRDKVFIFFCIAACVVIAALIRISVPPVFQVTVCNSSSVNATSI